MTITPKGNKQGSFETLFKKLNQNNLLTKIRISPKDDVIKLLSPFKFHKNQTPKWWKEYNNSKHRLSNLTLIVVTILDTNDLANRFLSSKSLSQTVKINFPLN